MRHIARIVAAIWLCAVPATANDDAVSADPDRNWPHWRGPRATGVAPHADPPIQWSEDNNVRWRTALPGVGHSTPVVWGDRVFITTAVPYGEPFSPIPDTAPGAHDNTLVTSRYEFVVMGIDRADGSIAWSRTVHRELPHQGGHVTGSLASNSPVTDGEHVIAFFGSRGLYCLDLDGALIWTRHLGRMETKHAHGEGSSPVLHGDTLVVNFDHEGASFVMALDKRTGAERWKVARDEPTSWASPIIVSYAGVDQVIVSGTNRVRGYDLASGRVIWECGGLSNNVVASPVSAQGIVYAGSSYERKAMMAVRLEGAEGDVSSTDRLVWFRRRRTPYVPSPLLYGEWLYFLHHYQGSLSRVHGPTGEETEGPFRLAGLRNVYASPVAAAGRIYVTDTDGATLVLSDETVPSRLALNRLDDQFSASAALVGGELFLRGLHSLYCIAKD